MRRRGDHFIEKKNCLTVTVKVRVFYTENIASVYTIFYINPISLHCYSETSKQAKLFCAYFLHYIYKYTDGYRIRKCFFKTPVKSSIHLAQPISIKSSLYHKILLANSLLLIRNNSILFRNVFTEVENAKCFKMAPQTKASIPRILKLHLYINPKRSFSLITPQNRPKTNQTLKG